MNTEIQAYIDRQTIVDKENLRHARKVNLPRLLKKVVKETNEIQSDYKPFGKEKDHQKN